MKKLQKALAFIAVFACLSVEIALYPVNVVSAGGDKSASTLAEDSIIDLSPIFPSQQAGTKENPYAVSSAYDFAKLIEASSANSFENTYFVQTGNITFNADQAFANTDGVLTTVAGAAIFATTPISTNAAFPFKGSYDGGGYALRGMVMNAQNGLSGLFGYAEGAEIKNIRIENSLSYMAATSGGIVAHAKRGTTVSGCTFDATVSYRAVTGYLGSYAGGIVGKLEADAAVQNCENRAVFQITKSPMETFIGGIVGSADGRVDSCINKGSIRVISSVGTLSCGGIAGELTDSGRISYCQNLSALSAEINNYVANLYIGGIVGENSGTVQYVRNREAISAIGFENYPCMVGGIIGYNRNGRVSSADNRGKIDGEIAYVGGIVGAQLAEGASASVDNCLNAGAVSAIDGTSGGLVGWNGAIGLNGNSGRSIIRNSVNTDTVGSGEAAYGSLSVKENASTAFALEHIYALAKTQDGVTTMTQASLSNAESLEGLDSQLWAYPHNGFAPAPVIVKQTTNPEIVGLWFDANAQKVAFAAVTAKAVDNAKAVIAFYENGRLIGTEICTQQLSVGTNLFTVSSAHAAHADEVRITAFGSLATLKPITEMDRF